MAVNIMLINLTSNSLKGVVAAPKITLGAGHHIIVELINILKEDKVETQSMFDGLRLLELRTSH